MAWLVRQFRFIDEGLRMSYLPDKYEKTVRIPVKVTKDGRLAFLYGGEMPPILEEVSGELILPQYAVTDEDWVERLQAERLKEILPRGEHVLIGIRYKEVPRGLSSHLFRMGRSIAREKARYRNSGILDSVASEYEPSPGWINGNDLVFIEAALTEPLSLRIRGTKLAALAGGLCTFVGDWPGAIPAKSLNHAYTLVSQVFEPNRRSHTGNVFERVRYLDEGRWRPLEYFRQAAAAEFEETVKAGDSETTSRGQLTL